MTRDRLAVVEAVAREILKARFAIDEADLSHQEAGLTNYVFEITTAHAPMVLRMGPRDEKEIIFRREQCVIELAREAGVPAPSIVASGETGDWVFMIEERMPGEPATDHPRRIDILRETARVAATQIHSIQTVGFGRDFAVEGRCNGGRTAWRTWLDNILGARRRIEFLHEQNIISDRQQEVFGSTLEAVKRWVEPAVLNHGDLRLKNVLVDREGQIVGLIDWDSCVACAGPHWDISVALHDLSIDEKEAFLEGYGLSADSVREFAPAWRLFNALNYVSEVERLLELEDEAALDRVRIRFRGALDLYAG